MTRQLRLASGVLTDVGRKRERNQDNVTSFIPTDPETLGERGALFVVCDGMGGHAAGEVASELGVNTIREVYFASQGQDVISSIAQSVKSANDAIYSLARARTEYSGMGTTCVTLVIAGGRAYIVNIGDSRAYIIRSGEMRQVTQDHSWVAEQVRIGLLTEEQARVHAHRNVITRSLGTQPNITADLFVETLRDGDRILMCSDGLHGYVEEDAIKQEVLTQSSAEQAVKNLIDMANANGGPDNISAIIVDILEAPEVTGPIPLPDNADEPIEEGATQPLPVPASVSPAAAAAAAATTTATATALTATKPGKPAKRVRRRRELYALRFLEAVALLLVLFAGWYIAFGPLAAQRAINQQAQDHLTAARHIIQQSSSQSPAQALTALAQARTLALTTANDTSIDPSVKSQAQSLLTQELAPAVQQALQRYNTAALIVPVKATSTVSYSFSCAIPGSSAPTAITSMSSLVPVSASAGKPALVSGQQPLYFINGGSLYEALVPVDANGAPTTGQTTCALVAVKGVSSFLSIAADGATAYALAQQAAGGYSVISVETGPVTNGAPTMKTTPLFTVPVTQETPTHLAVAGPNFFVSYASGATTPFGVWLFNSQPKTPGGPATSAQTISLPSAAASLLAANNSLYILLTNGAVGQLDPTHIYASIAVVAQLPATTIDPSTYTSATPVPTVQNPAATPTSAATSTPAIGEVFTSDAMLAADPLAPAHLVLSDPANNRLLGLGTNANAPGVTLLSQYVYSAPIANLGVVAFTGSGTTLNVLSWSNGHLLTFSVPESAHA